MILKDLFDLNDVFGGFIGVKLEKFTVVIVDVLPMLSLFLWCQAEEIFAKHGVAADLLRSELFIGRCRNFPFLEGHHAIEDIFG